MRCKTKRNGKTYNIHEMSLLVWEKKIYLTTETKKRTIRLARYPLYWVHPEGEKRSTLYCFRKVLRIRRQLRIRNPLTRNPLTETIPCNSHILLIQPQSITATINLSSKGLATSRFKCIAQPVTRISCKEESEKKQKEREETRELQKHVCN